MRKLRYVLFILIFMIIPKTYCQDFNVASENVSCPIGQGTGKYCGFENYIGGMSAVYNLNTRYNGRLGRIWFNLVSGGYADPDGFEKGHTYTLTMPMATDDWRNNFGSVSIKCEGSSGEELSNGRVNYISMKKIKVSFTTPTDRYCQFVLVNLYSTNQSSVAFTGVSNWQLNNFIITDPYYISGGSGSGGGGSSATPTPTPQPNNQDIINNQNQNTENIIESQNNNTTDIINNQNSNTQDIIDSNNSNTQNIIDNQNKNTDKTNALLGSCHKNIFNLFNYNDYTNTRYTKTDRPIDHAIVLQSNAAYTGGSFPLIWPITLEPNTTYHFQSNNSITNGSAKAVFYVYHSTPSTSSNLVYYTDDMSDFSFTTPSQDYKNYYIQLYITGSQTNGVKISLQRPMLFKDNYISSSYVPYNEEKCSSKLDDTTNSINDLNDSITDSNIDNNTGTGFFDNFSNNDHGLSSIITIPLNTIQSLTSSSCVALQLPIPFTNSSVSLPCMTEIYQSKIPTIYNLWKIVSFGIIAYLIAIDIFHMVKGFKDPESDKVEVLDL